MFLAILQFIVWFLCCSFNKRRLFITQTWTQIIPASNEPYFYFSLLLLKITVICISASCIGLYNYTCPLSCYFLITLPGLFYRNSQRNKWVGMSPLGELDFRKLTWKGYASSLIIVLPFFFFYWKEKKKGALLLDRILSIGQVLHNVSLELE